MSDKPAVEIVESAVELASRAPSIHNTQPWQWRWTPSALELYADGTRLLASADPTGRSLLISCGAALNHLVVAMGARGWASRVDRMPDARIPILLATVRFQPEPETRRWKGCAEAIAARRSDRRQLSSWPVPASHVVALTDVAKEYGAMVEALDDGMEEHVWESLAQQVAKRRDGEPAYQKELHRWVGVASSSSEGIPDANLTEDRPSDWGPRAAERFPAGSLSQAVDESDPPISVSPLLTTSSDDALSRLRAGRR